MRGLRVRWTFSGIPPQIQTFLETLPGVCALKAPYFPKLPPPTPDPGPFVAGQSVDAPIDGMATAQHYLSTFALQPASTVFYTRSGILPVQPSPHFDELPSIRPEILREAFSYQRDGYTVLSPKGGGLAHWQCGSGKSRLGLFFADGDRGSPHPTRPALFAPRRIVVVTLAATTIQWASVLREITHPNSMPYMLLANETSITIRLTPRGPILFRVVPLPPRPALQLGDWFPAYPQDVRLRLFTKLYLTILAIPQQTLQQRYLRASPRSQKKGQPFPEATAALLARLEQGPVPMEEIPAPIRTVLRKHNLITEERAQATSLWEVLGKDKTLIASYTGYEVLILTPQEVSSLASKIQGHEVQEAERTRARILLLRSGVPGTPAATPEEIATTTGTPLPQILDLLAKTNAQSTQARLRGICDAGPETQVCILSWNLLPARREWLRDWQPTTIVYDESQWVKSPSIWTVEQDGFGNPKYLYNQSVAASAHYLSESCPRILLLSATPAPDRVRDWWGQMQVLTKGFGKYRTYTDRFCAGTMTQINEQLTIYDDSGESNVEELNARLGWWVHRVTKEDMKKEVPPLLREIVRIPQSELSAVNIPQNEWRDAKARGAQGLQELYTLIAAAAKRPFVTKFAIEYLQQGQKIIIFSGRILDCEATFRDILKAFPPPKDTKAPTKDGKIHLVEGKNAWLMHGELANAADIQNMATIWKNHPGPCLLVGTEEILGTGVDGLQATHRLLRPKLPITPLQWEQPEGRVDRAGTDMSTIVTYFWGEGTIDDRIMDLFADKMRSVAQTYGALSSRMEEVVRTFQGTGTEAEAIEALCKHLVENLPESTYEDFDDDE